MRRHLAWDSSITGAEAERASEPNGYTKPSKCFVSVVAIPSFATPLSTIWTFGPKKGLSNRRLYSPNPQAPTHNPGRCYFAIAHKTGVTVKWLSEQLMTDVRF
jgi:hypothetical protein